MPSNEGTTRSYHICNWHSLKNSSSFPDDGHEVTLKYIFSLLDSNSILVNLAFHMKHMIWTWYNSRIWIILLKYLKIHWILAVVVSDNFSNFSLVTFNRINYYLFKSPFAYPGRLSSVLKYRRVCSVPTFDITPIVHICIRSR